MSQTVYFMRDAAGLTKIGFTSNLGTRHELLQREVGGPLQVLATVPGGIYLEARFHSFFRAHHSHSEWFKPCAELEAVIAAVNAGTFDIDTLPDDGFWLRREAALRTWARRKASVVSEAAA